MPREFILTGTALLLSAGAGAVAAPLTVTVEGVETREGPIYVSVVTEDQYASMGREMTAGTREEEVTVGSMTFTYDVPPGSYAVNVWHDDNGNGQFDFGARGPEDGIGVSGGLPEFRAATFEEAKFEVTGEGAAVSVAIRYNR